MCIPHSVTDGFSSLIVFLAFFMAGCNNNPVTPKDLEPGRRDYIWTVDTLNMPMNYIASVWGASPNDVWAVGAGGTYKDRLLHYDGEDWSTYTNEPIWCTGNVIFGFSEDDIWMGGGAGWLEHGAGIWHYDGAKWSQYYVYNIKNSPIMYVQDIWGAAPDNIYASGLFVFNEDSTENAYGFLLHFNGKNWEEIAKADFESQFLTVREENGTVYLFSSSSRVDGNYHFYKLEEKKLVRLYSNSDARGLYSIDGNVYFVIGQGIFRHLNEKFVEQLSINNENFTGPIYGRNEVDLFFGMVDGLTHYNGTGVEYLYTSPQKNITLRKNAAVFKREVFFCALNKNLKNLVFHGELKE
ncbi:MAG: hypothetical protein K9N46_11925 [Candidatus Marinimicrobia bacterium]|nr:hypothetical protein [Candidatus Neomarinimicrobiota bacterium]MCF7827763.1 hypothetical protein [Candidatus Neomarinimicrobiota bacterium]MCF7881437.1 hypothetical protein [Candidatus Neomarinimicrobiota bacterium]